MSEIRDIVWKDIWFSYAIGLVGTAILGGIVFVLFEPNMWYLTAVSVVALLVAGFWLARRKGEWEGISAALVALFYFATATFIIIIGWMFEFLPDPLPGLPKGDSTFYFLWPLFQLLSLLIGTSLGARLLSSKRRR